MEITLTRPIAEGRTAEIYEWQDGTILKLYHEWCPSSWVEYESKAAHAVVAAGIPTPAAGEIVEVNGRRGLIFERVSGISMVQDLNVRPWNLFKHARTLAELQYKINCLSFPGFMPYKDELAYAIRQAPHMDDHTREKVLDLLSGLQDGDRVCHGDFHPGNIMLTDKGAIVIDWITVRLGNPMADFARTSMILTVGPKGAGKLLSPIVMSFIKIFHKIYTSHYLHRIPDKNNERQKWLTVNAAARLAEQIEPERQELVTIIEKGIMQR